MAHALDRHIALIGFMGAGKTTLGSRVADLIGRQFFDLDQEIEKSVRRSIPISSAAKARRASGCSKRARP